uniref:Ig-like domain-containing protein n=1 Tax=Lates calcarifer TaxID=8187 RepID=A0A4W6BS08_LATCA
MNSCNHNYWKTPPVIIKKTGESVTSEIKCSHSITSYNTILWYKQEGQRALKLLGYVFTTTATSEDDVKGKISFDGDGRKQSSLTISNLSSNDSLYFCAVSEHSDTDTCETCFYFCSGTKVKFSQPPNLILRLGHSQ